MDSKPDIPISLKIVAWLFIISGVFSVIEVAVSLMNGRINLNLGVLGLFIGPGLLNLRPGWRTCALVFIWIALILVPVVVIILMGVSGPLDVTVFGQKVGHTGKEIGLAVGVLVFALTFWQYRVLTRPDVRQLFGIA